MKLYRAPWSEWSTERRAAFVGSTLVGGLGLGMVLFLPYTHGVLGAVLLAIGIGWSVFSVWFE